MHTDKKTWLNSSIRQDIFLIMVFVTLGNLFLFRFKVHERYIYYWDIAGYWINAIDYTKLFFSEPREALLRLYQSLLHDDYTLLPVLAYLPIFRFFSMSSAAFVLTTYNAFGVPFLIVSYVFFKRQFAFQGLREKCLVLLILFSFTTFLTPIMGGYLDACGLAAVMLLLLLVQKWDMRRFSLPRIAALSFLTLVIGFLRRWYSFYIISFYTVFFICQAVAYGLEGLKSRKTFVMFTSLFLSGLGWLVVLAVFFRAFLQNAIFNNFSFAYSAYDFGGIRYSVSFIVQQAGVFIMLLSAAGLIWTWVKKEKLPFALFMVLQAVFMLFHFTRVQSVGIQHIYLFIPVMLYFTIYIAVQIARYPKSNHPFTSVFGGTFIAALFAVNFVNCYFDHGSVLIQSVEPVLSQKKLYRRNREDIDEINRLVDTINEISQGMKYTYVLSSSGTLNSDILRNARLPETRYAVPKLLYTFDVDKRDGFPHSFYLADILVVAEPVQYHLAPENQRIIGILSEAVLDGNSEDSLALLSQFDLENGVTANIYVKTGPYSHSFIQSIEDRFAEVYPDFDFLRSTTSVLSYMFDLRLQKDRNCILQGPNSIGLDVGRDGAGFSLNLENSMSILRFDAKAGGGAALRITDGNGTLLTTGTLTAESQHFEADLTGLETVVLELTCAYDVYVSLSNLECLP